MTKKVTMQQIADHLGVSKFVVSKALSGKGGVSTAAKERVLEAAAQLGYFTQHNGNRLRGKREEKAPKLPTPKHSILVLMPNVRYQTMDSTYWGKIIDGISANLSEYGCGMVILSEQKVENLRNILNLDGILGMIGVGVISSAILLEIHRLGLPMVLVDHEDSLIPADTLFLNNIDSMNRLTRHLLAIGHRNLQFIGNVGFSRSFQDRFAGYRAAMEEAGLTLGGEAHGYLSLDGLDHYEDQLVPWLSSKKEEGRLPTALVCANDSIALGAIEALTRLGLSVPDDVSVTGFDNIEDSVWSSPPLTTVHVPKEALGRRAVRQLMDRIHAGKDPYEKILLAGEIVYRGSIREWGNPMPDNDN
ncbi:LacI family DNA-binding transcriptional regulator [Gorillibacterium timonense]|uniref:LacI family DNA-binding transcriptional regulator n=1 Tax=Gorillibacterium timonense TaxID=1689269 RepID=UPI00071E6386|nr:LacI family DNA-binding transcriptional regulator [Gorillibacterium timonense]